MVNCLSPSGSNALTSTSWPKENFSALIAAAIILASASAGRGELVFNLTPANGMSQQAINGFAAAADLWSGLVTDNATINININMAALPAGAGGTTASTQAFYSYSSVRTALVADEKSTDDATAVAHLPIGSAMDLWINRTSNSPNGSGSSTPYLDSDGDANNTTMRITNANAKALGLLPANNPATDASITISTAVPLDYDRSNGISAGTYDFIGFAAHEIGHALGFFSGEDVLDRNSINGDFAPDDQFMFVSVMDLYRYSVDSAAQAAIDWTADTRPKFFSIDAGTTALANFSTGLNWGDGNQPHHWKENVPTFGILDPHLDFGELALISNRDVQMLDVIGYNLVPEPSTATLLGLAVMCLWGRRAKTRGSSLFPSAAW